MSAESVPGRVSVSSRALARVFAAVAAEEFGVPAGSVTARVRDDGGRLGVTVEGPVRRHPSMPGLVQLGERARSALLERGGRVAGVVVGGVSIRVSDLETVRERVH